MEIPINDIPESLADITDLNGFKSDLKDLLLSEIDNAKAGNIYFMMQLFSNVNVYPKRNADFNLRAFISDYLITGNVIVNLFQSFLRAFIPDYAVISESLQESVIALILEYS